MVAVVTMTHYIICALATEMFAWFFFFFTLKSINRKTLREQKINYLQVASHINHPISKLKLLFLALLTTQ